MKLTSTKVLLFAILLVLTGQAIHIGALASVSGLLVILGLLLGLFGLLIRDRK